VPRSLRARTAGRQGLRGSQFHGRRDANVTALFGRSAGGTEFHDQAALVNVTFRARAIGAGLWTITTAPLSLGDAATSVGSPRAARG
jgi:hypothetical protein